jgi:hypothetical protein
MPTSSVTEIVGAMHSVDTAGVRALLERTLMRQSRARDLRALSRQQRQRSPVWKTV